MKTTTCFRNSNRSGRKRYSFVDLLPALVVCLGVGLLPGKLPAQSVDVPTGVASFELMAEYLSRNTGQWRAPLPPQDGGPDGVGLWFERTARGKLLELTVVLFYGDEIRQGLRGNWFWHPGREEIVYQEVSTSGRVRLGTSHFTDEKTFVTLTEAIGIDGKTTSNRGVNILTSDNEHRTAAFALDAQGQWIEQQALDWIRESVLIELK